MNAMIIPNGKFQGIPIETGIPYATLRELNLNPDKYLQTPRKIFLKLRSIAHELWIDGIYFNLPEIINIPSMILESDRFKHKDLRSHSFAVLIELVENQTCVRLLRFSINKDGEPYILQDIRDINDELVLNNFLLIEG